MIVKPRIDDRLLHGQVAYSWRAKLSYDAIVIISEDVVNDEIRKMTIKMCCPTGVKLAIRNIVDGIKLLNDERLKNLKVFVICADPKTVSLLLEGITEKPVINLGGMQMKDNRKFFSKAVYLSYEDRMYLNKIDEMGYEIEIQEVPETVLTKYKNSITN